MNDIFPDDLFSDALFPDEKWRRRVIALAALWFVGWLLLLAPAQLAARFLHVFAPQVELDTVEGSLWHGTAQQTYLRFGEQRLALGRVEWKLNGWSLLWLHPSLHLNATWGDQILDTQVRLSPLRTATLSETRALFPVDILKIWAPVPARGAIGLNLQRAEFSASGPGVIEGAIDWHAAQWQWGASWLALGNYRIEMHPGKNSGLTGDISGEGDLAMHGTADIDTDKRQYRVDAKLSVSRALPEEFRNSLVFLLGAKPAENSAVGAGAPLPMVLSRQGKW